MDPTNGLLSRRDSGPYSFSPRGGATLRYMRPVAVPLLVLTAFLTAILLAFVGRPATPARATTFDAAIDFSPTSNPNGPWSYGFIPVGGLYTDFVLHDLGGPAPDIPGLDAWRHTSGSSDPRVPAVAHNGGSSTLYAYGDIVLPPGEMHLHPGPEGQESVVRFTAPFGGSFQIGVTFSVGDPPPCATTTDVHVHKNGVSLFDGDVSGYVSPSDSEHFSGVQTLAAGAIIDFTVGFGNGNYGCDTTFLELQVSATSSPTPTPTPTPTPIPTPPPGTPTPTLEAVGGIVELITAPGAPPAVSRGSDDGGALMVVLGVSAMLVLGSGGLYVVKLRRG